MYYWTDSEIVLEYISNGSKRFKTFVANRVEKILETSEPSQWNHVISTNNPADHASRGLRTGDSETVSQWLHGPDFLRQPVDVHSPQLTGACARTIPS